MAEDRVEKGLQATVFSLQSSTQMFGFATGMLGCGYLANTYGERAPFQVVVL